MYESHGLHLLEPEGVPTHGHEKHLFGTPLSLYRYGGMGTLSAAKRWMSGRQDAALAHELAMSFTLGVCWQRARAFRRQRGWGRKHDPEEVMLSPQAGSEAKLRPSPALLRSGACVWLTGLSGAGKTTTAKALEDLLRRRCPVRVLDGDALRASRPPEPSPFSMADRHAHAVRVAELARRHADDGILVVCALISPYSHSRSEARTIIGAHRFVEAFVNTPLDVCMTRDVKGLYAKALRGDLSRVTGIDDPYEPPDNPAIVLDTLSHTPFANALSIADFLETRGLIPVESPGFEADDGAPVPVRPVPLREPSI
jgi:adenylyl-sulfate kinase